MSKTDSLENGQQFNLPATGSASESDTENGLNDALTDDLVAIDTDGQLAAADAAIGQLDGQADADLNGQADLPQAKRRGAPLGNLNGFKSGSTYMRQAKAGDRPADDSKVIARRFARALIEDLGGKGMLSAQKREIIDHLKRDRETLQDLHAAKDEIFELQPKLRRNIAAIAKIDQAIAPVQQRVVNNLLRLGLERVVREIEIAPWETEKK
jgi:hypothetical protein